MSTKLAALRRKKLAAAMNLASPGDAVEVKANQALETMLDVLARNLSSAHTKMLINRWLEAQCEVTIQKEVAPVQTDFKAMFESMGVQLTDAQLLAAEMTAQRDQAHADRDRAQADLAELRELKDSEIGLLKLEKGDLLKDIATRESICSLSHVQSLEEEMSAQKKTIGDATAKDIELTTKLNEVNEENAELSICFVNLQDQADEVNRDLLDYQTKFLEAQEEKNMLQQVSKSANGYEEVMNLQAHIKELNAEVMNLQTEMLRLRQASK